ELQLELFEEERARSKPPAAVVVLSGGQDSTTCLFWARHTGFEVHAVTFDYNQRHAREIEAATKVAKLAGVLSHEIIALGPVLKGTSPLISDNALEQYADHKSLPGGIEKTFVPMRNQLFLTIAANRAYVHNAEALVTGVSEEDYGGYPDCRSAFIDALTHACNLGTFTGEDGAPAPLTILTPLIRMTKKATVALALTLPGCYAALAWTHPSYAGAYPPVGRDNATLRRAKGFEEANVPVPLVLRADVEGLMDLADSPNYAPEVGEKYLEQLARDTWLEV